MAERMICHVCGNMGFDCDDGLFHCQMCGSQAENMVETGVADEDFIQGDNHAAIYSQGHRRLKKTVVKTEPLTLSSQQTQGSQFWRNLNEEHKPIKQEYDEMKPSVPDDFGGSLKGVSFSPEAFSSEIRIRYVMGIQLMIQYQCEALVERFGASPLVCGLAGVIWMRFVAASRVFEERWADDIFEDSEIRKEGDVVVRKPRSKYKDEPHNIYGQRAVTIWLRSLRKIIPLSSCLAVSFLACHVSREAILPTDILKWSLEGKLPYLNAFLNIEKHFGPPSTTCPLSSSFMFRPSQVVGSRELESQAGSIAQRIGLQLPPVNFYAIARRYLKQLQLPVEKIFPYASLIYEWSMPPDLWLSANLHRLPSRVCVMSIIMLAIRVLYNINGFGKWEEKFSDVNGSSSCRRVKRSNSKCMPPGKNSTAKECSQPSDHTKAIRGSLLFQNSDFDTGQLLCELEVTYDKICDTHEYSKDLPTYLKFCRDVVFDGLTPPFEDFEEEKIIDRFWEFYENQEDSEPPEKAEIGCSSGFNQRRANNVSMDDARPTIDGCISNTPIDSRTSGDNCSSSPQEDQNPLPCSDDASVGTIKERALKRMKSNMEENGFCYIPPRVNIKRFDYLHYVRKNDGGTRRYVAHADYYILLRACARVAQVDARYMHLGMLRFEKRLAWLENQIDRCLHLRPGNVSPKSNVDGKSPQDMGESLDFSNYKSNVDVESQQDLGDSLDFSNYKFVI
ncbi:hypothetical protein BVC80_9097g73 [Macleaya cordata]|uniref:TATA box-binding protein-associated factor RNA polymerase I subunit B n=1 Tax=Macleaya cordata TaxID=56857 RepID=A0A200QEW8_MACCD|nr:hypothetical protein BVC80_9097g73 [Macleaya cordata]